MFLVCGIFRSSRKKYVARKRLRGKLRGFVPGHEHCQIHVRTNGSVALNFFGGKK
jgi:hypothetical protein